MKAFRTSSRRGRAAVALATVVVLALVAAVVALADVVNGGFETGDFTGWTPAGSYAIADAGMDPWIPSLPKVYEGQYSGQIGDVAPMFPISPTWESTLAQTAIVPDYMPSLELHYAAVALEAHSEGESAGYEVTVLDVTTGETVWTTLSYCYDTGVTNPPPPGWIREVTIPANSLDYTGWQAQTLDLRGREGHSITIEFRTFDCVHGEHWAYGYLDSVVISAEPTPTPTATGTIPPVTPVRPTAPPTVVPNQPPVVPEASTLLLVGSAAVSLAGYAALQMRARRK